MICGTIILRCCERELNLGILRRLAAVSDLATASVSVRFSHLAIALESGRLLDAAEEQAEFVKKDSHCVQRARRAISNPYRTR